MRAWLRSAALGAMLWPLWGPVLAGGEGFYARDTGYYYTPQKAFEVQTVAAGILPSWNPAMRLGTPHAANPTMGVLDPLNAVHHLFPGSLGVSLRLLASLLLLGFGAALLARRLGAGRGGAWLAGVLAALSGPALGYLSNPFYLHGLAYCWIAPVALRSGWRPAARTLGVALGLALPFLAGDPQAALLSGFLCALLLPSAPGRRPWHILLLGGLGALLLALPQLLETLELLGGSSRSLGGGAGPDAFAGRWAFPLPRLLDLAVPASFGPTLPDYAFFGGGLYAGAAPAVEPWFESVHAGSSVALPLALLALGGTRSPARRARRWLLGGAVALVILAAGPALGVLPALQTLLPPLGWFRYPEKYMAYAAFLLAVLSGPGLSRLARLSAGSAGAPGRGRRAAGLVASALALTALSVALLPPSLWVERLQHVPVAATAHAWHQLAGLLAALPLGLLALGLLLPRPAPWIAAAVALLAGLQATLTADLLAHTAPRALLDSIPALARYEQGRGRLVSDAVLDRARGEGLYRDAKAYQGLLTRDRALLRAFSGELPGVRRLGGYTAAYLDHPLLRWSERQIFRRASQLLPLLGIDTYVGPDRPMPKPLATLFEPVEIEPWPGVRVRRFRHPLPLARCVPEVLSASSPTGYLAEHPALDPAHTAIIRERSLARAAPASTRPGEVQVLDARPGRWALRIRSEAPCLLVVAESFAPGWTAALDGREVPVVDAYDGLLAAPIPAGRHDLRLAHRARHAPWLAAGLALALAAVGLWLRGRRSGAISEAGGSARAG